MPDGYPMDYPDELEDMYEDVTVDDATPMDCVIIAEMLLEMNMPVPVDLIAKAHSAGLYFAH